MQLDLTSGEQFDARPFAPERLEAARVARDFRREELRRARHVDWRKWRLGKGGAMSLCVSEGKQALWLCDAVTLSVLCPTVTLSTLSLCPSVTRCVSLWSL